jgi:hypothetical protein
MAMKRNHSGHGPFRGCRATRIPKTRKGATRNTQPRMVGRITSSTDNARIARYGAAPVHPLSSAA